VVGVAYNDTIEARGGTLPYHFTIQSGHLPSGLTLDGTFGVVDGTPTDVETDTFTVRCTDSSDPVQTDDQLYVVNVSSASVLVITTLSLPNGRQDSIYNETIGVSGGLQPYHFSLVDGQLPDTLTLDATDGVISGIPITAGSNTFTVHCEDSSIPPLFDEHSYIIAIAPTPCIYIPGDANGSNSFNGLDVTFSVSYFKGGPPPPFTCECTPGHTWYVAGDVNQSCSFNGLDVTYMVAYLKGGPPPNPCGDCPPGGMILMNLDDPASIGGCQTK
jgi:hypothetical protein